MDVATGTVTEPLLIVETPPRHGKSELCSRYLPAWVLGLWPHKRILHASHAANFSASWGRKTRDLVKRNGPRYFGISVSKDHASAHDWDVAHHGGGMTTSGVGGDIMGRDGDVLIIDDYLKNAEAALSPVTREKQWDWWQTTFSTRWNPDGWGILIATRWHRDDLVGRIEKAFAEGEGVAYRKLTLPAIAPPTTATPDPLGRQPGEPLWPAMWPIGDGDPNTKDINSYGKRVVGLASRRKMLDRYWWEALYQQNPIAYGKVQWPSAYFGRHIWTKRLPREEYVATACVLDPALGRRTKRGDYNAAVWGGIHGNHIVIDARLRRIPPARMIPLVIEQLYRPRGTDVFGVEANSFQELLAPEFEREAKKLNIGPIPLKLIHNKQNKELRIQRLGPLLERKKLLFLDNPDCRLLVAQLEEFPLGQYDDGPDALEMMIRLLNWATRRQLEPDRPEEQQLLVS